MKRDEEKRKNKAVRQRRLRSPFASNSVYRIPFYSGSRPGTPFRVATSQDIAGVGEGFQSQLLQITDSTYTDATFGKVTSKTGQRSMQPSLRYSV